MDQQQSKRVPELWEINDQIQVVGHSIMTTDEADPIQTPGWFRTFADLADVPEIWFLNIRNRVAGLHNNTQETRDSLSWGYRALEFSLDWWTSFTTQHIDIEVRGGGDGKKVDPITAHLWRVVIPRETSFEFFVANDSKLEINAAMIAGGCGFTGGGIASGFDFYRGTPGEGDDPAVDPYIPSVTGFAQVCNGIPTRRLEKMGQDEFGGPLFAGGAGGWPQAFAIDLPKGVNIAARLQFSPYARNLLRNMNTASVLFGHDILGGEVGSQKYLPVKAGIKLRVHGTAYKQQRGALER